MAQEEQISETKWHGTTDERNKMFQAASIAEYTDVKIDREQSCNRAVMQCCFLAVYVLWAYPRL